VRGHVEVHMEFYLSPGNAISEETPELSHTPRLVVSSPDVEQTPEPPKPVS
jgi:hypothetical protein